MKNMLLTLTKGYKIRTKCVLVRTKGLLEIEQMVY